MALQYVNVRQQDGIRQCLSQCWLSFMTSLAGADYNVSGMSGANKLVGLLIANKGWRQTLVYGTSATMALQYVNVRQQDGIRQCLSQCWLSFMTSLAGADYNVSGMSGANKLAGLLIANQGWRQTLVYGISATMALQYVNVRQQDGIRQCLSQCWLSFMTSLAGADYNVSGMSGANKLVGLLIANQGWRQTLVYGISATMALQYVNVRQQDGIRQCLSQYWLSLMTSLAGADYNVSGMSGANKLVGLLIVNQGWRQTLVYGISATDTWDRHPGDPAALLPNSVSVNQFWKRYETFASNLVVSRFHEVSRIMDIIRITWIRHTSCHLMNKCVIVSIRWSTLFSRRRAYY